MEPNRLQTHWNVLKPRICQAWQLSEDELANVQGNFDNLVHTIRLRHFSGRSKLGVEAVIRDWLLAQLDEQDFKQD